jgi:hypothetical protein
MEWKGSALVHLLFMVTIKGKEGATNEGEERERKFWKVGALVYLLKASSSWGFALILGSEKSHLQ